MDRDARFSKSFRACLRREGLKPVRLLPRSPNFNAHLERFFGSLKTECLHKLILFGETTTRKAVRALVTHYHTERNHQGLENELIVPLVLCEMTFNCNDMVQAIENDFALSPLLL